MLKNYTAWGLSMWSMDNNIHVMLSEAKHLYDRERDSSLALRVTYRPAKGIISWNKQ